jgi:Ca2+-binding RTX toxin-like protein
MSNSPEDLLKNSDFLFMPFGSDWNFDKHITISFADGVYDHIKVAIQKAAALLKTYTQLEFEYVESGSSADITINQQYGMTMPSGLTKYGEANPTTWVEDFWWPGTVTFNSEFFEHPSWGFEGSLLNYTAMHELFHVLGAGHTDNLVFFNTASLSIMSYWFQHDPLGPGMIAPSTYSSLDILSLQAWYGAKGATNQLANQYTFTDTSVFKTIYDVGGVDTIDVSALSGTVFLDLRPGFVSQQGDKSIFGLAFSGDVIQAAIDRQWWNDSNASNLDTRIENAIGSMQADRIIGNSADNLLLGLAGDDFIYGGNGSDTLVGGQGNDHIVGNFTNVPSGAIDANYAASISAYSFEDVLGEIDTADYSTAYAGNAGMTSGITVDMRLSTEQVTNDGFGDKDTLVSIERIVGSAGRDVFYMGGTLKHVVGGGDFDFVSFVASKAAVEIDLNQAAQSGGLAEGVTLTDIQGARGSVYNDTIYLKDGELTRGWGDKGNDTIFSGLTDSGGWGGDGNDTFFHMGGNSFFHGEAGTNDLNLSLVDDGFTFDMRNATGKVRKIGSPSGSTDDVTFTGVQKVVASVGDDTFLLKNNVMNGVIDGGDGIDTLDFSWSSASIGVNFWINLVQTGNGLTKLATVTNVERVYGGSAGDFFAAGGIADYFHGNGGNDTFFGGGAIDTFYGGTGVDIADYRNSLSTGVTIDLNQPVQSGGLANGDKLYDVESIVGSPKDDNLTNRQDVGGNNSTIDGLGGHDTIHLYGIGATARGGDGNDLIYKEIGASQKLYGGANNDQFIFASSFQNATIYDYNTDDIIKVSSTAGLSIEIDGSKAILHQGSDMLTILGSAASSLTMDDIFLV